MKQIISILLMLILVGCDSASDIDYVSNAEAYLDEGKLKSASIELKNALALAPDNPKARWLLGKLYLEIGNGFAAEKELNQARKLGVKDESVLPVLLKALLQQRKYSEVLEQDIKTVTSNRATAEILATRGLAYIYQQKIDDAGVEIDDALQRDPNSVEALTVRARLSAAKNNFAEAEGYLQKAFSQNERFAPAWSLRGAIAVRQGKTDVAIDAFEKAIKNRFNNQEDRLKRALLFIQLQQYDAAQKDLNSLKQRFPKHPALEFPQGVLYFAQKMFFEAEDAFENALKYLGKEPRVLFYLGAVKYQLRNYEQAESYLSHFVDLMPGYTPALKLLTTIKIKGKKFKEAEKIIFPVHKAKPDDVDAMNLLANAYSGQGKTADAISLLQKIADLNPASPEAKMQLGVGLIAHGEKEAAFQSLEAAVEVDPELPQANSLLISNLLSENKFSKALKAAEFFILHQPENFESHNMLGHVYFANKDYNKAHEAYLKAWELAPGHPGPGNNLALLAEKEGAYDKARKYYADILKKYPGDLVTLVQFAKLEDSQGHKAEALKILMNAVEKNKSAIKPRIMLAREYLNLGKLNQANTLFTGLDKEIRREPFVLGMQGEIYLAARKYIDAKHMLQQLVEIMPDQGQSHYLLAKAYKGLQDNVAYKKELSRCLEIVPEHLAARLALAQQLVTEDKLELARKHLTKLKEQEGDSPSVIALEAAILAKAGKVQQARELYSSIFEKEATMHNLLALAQFEWSIGKREQANAYLKDWLKDNPEDVKILMVLANNYQGMKKEADAVDLYKRVLSITDSNAVALNNLAWYLREADSEQALLLAEKANSIAPDLVTVKDTLAMIFLEKGNTTKAQRLIERALKIMPHDPTLQYHHALILEKVSGPLAAQKALQVLLSNEEAFSERKEAELALKRISALLM